MLGIRSFPFGTRLDVSFRVPGVHPGNFVFEKSSNLKKGACLIWHLLPPMFIDFNFLRRLHKDLNELKGCFLKPSVVSITGWFTFETWFSTCWVAPMKIGVWEQHKERTVNMWILHHCGDNVVIYPTIYIYIPYLFSTEDINVCFLLKKNIQTALAYIVPPCWIHQQWQLLAGILARPPVSIWLFYNVISWKSRWKTREKGGSERRIREKDPPNDGP